MLCGRQGVGSTQQGSLGKAPCLALPSFCSICCVFGLRGITSPRPPLYSTMESTSSQPSVGGDNETPVSPLNRFSFRSTVLTAKVSRCSRSPTSHLPPLPFLSSHLPLLVPGSVQGNAISPQPSAAPLTQSYLKLPALARIGACVSLPSAPAQTSGTVLLGALLRMLGHSGVARGWRGGNTPLISLLPSPLGDACSLCVSGSSGCARSYDLVNML